MAMNKKIVSTIALSAATAAMLTLSGCGSSSDSSTTPPPAVDPTTLDTAYDYFVKDSMINIQANGSITYNDNSVTGVDETAIWKGTTGSNAPLEDPTSSAATADLTAGKTLVDITANITGDTTWTAGNVYVLDGHIKVESGTLTIEPGTVVAGKIPNSYLLIDTGAQIDANGTQASPITFTSLKDAQGQSTENAAGEWGGLILAGNAYTHYGVGKYEADETVVFGCDEDNGVACVNDQSSGTLNYVAIKHSGYEVEKDKELNGLSLAGVGSGTTITNVAVIGGLDDAMEIWGGRVNITGLYLYNGNDDSVDTDLGYRGTITNVLVRQVNVDNDNNHDSACMEFGNDHNTITTDDSNATQPTIVNFTAYVKGGGFYNKNDAGFIWNNVKFVSEKTADYEQVHFRSADAYSTGAKQITGPVTFIDSAVTLTEDNTYSKKNSKVQ